MAFVPAWGLVIGAALGCGGRSEERDRGAPEPPAPVELARPSDLWALPLGAVRDATLARGNRAAEAAGTAEGVESGREAARWARVLALRDRDADWRGRARAWLTEASRRASLPGACAAALELAELEARDASDLEAAYRVALRTRVRAERGRFGSEGAACAERARAMTDLLEPYRPSAADLATILADPDGDDPTVVAAEAPGEGAPASPLARWARAHAEGEGDAVLTGLTVYGRGDGDAASVRTVLRFDRVVAFERTEDGPLLRVRVERARLGEDVVRELAVETGGLIRLACSERAGGVEVVLERTADARTHAFLLPSPFRLVFDVDGPAVASAPGPVRTIVLDPGHGGDDHGARGFGQREADLVLDLALRARAVLRRDFPSARVVLTREDDVFLSLEQRSAIANAIGADLFLSIHLNGFEEPLRRGGLTTFVLDTSDDEQALRLAALENGTDRDRVGALDQLLAGLHREAQVTGSRALAAEIHAATLARGRAVLPSLRDRGLKSALFHVLVGARMPAVLLEASFLSVEREAEALRTPAYRQALAEGIAAGIVRWGGP